MRTSSLMLLMSVLVACISQSRTVAAPVEITFTPKPIPIESQELVNPLRGLYQWRGQEMVPSPDPLPRPALDSYERFEWRDLEPERDQYDFTVIDQAADRAAHEGRRLGFRVRALINGEGEKVPDYLDDLMERGWWHDSNDNGEEDTYVPDWNDPDFMDRVGKLIAVLGERYNNDPRIAYLDIGIYGSWGEWHLHGFPYPSPTEAEPMSTANRQAIIDMHIAAFPNKQLLMMSDDEYALAYALNRSPTIGWRRDSLGSKHFEKVTEDSQLWKIASNRWRTAPVVAEFISPGQQSDPEVYLTALEQVRRYHISLIGNGNTLQWSDLSHTGRAAFLLLGKTAGYRFVLNQLSLSEPLVPGASFQVQSAWSNVGVAPAYERWNVMIQLRNLETGTTVWEGLSGVNLMELLPPEDGTEGEPKLQQDTFTLPAELPIGTYEVTLMVRDPNEYLAPLALAITGVRADGSYPLGTVRIGE